MSITALFQEGRAWSVASAAALLASAWLLPLTGAAPAAAQKAPARAKCRPLVVDVRAGTVNGMGPKTPIDRVRKRLPCFTGETKEGELFNYGGGLFYVDHNVYFYTYLRFIEIRAPFNGSLQPQIFGRSKAQLAREFPFNQGASGRPNWGTANDEFVTAKFGCIQFSFAGDTVKEMRFYAAGCDALYEPR